MHTVADMPTDYRLAPIDPDIADNLRIHSGERFIADAKPGYPCRQCLCDAEIGEALILVAHDPCGAGDIQRARRSCAVDGV